MKYILSSNPKGYIILPTKELVENEIFKRLLKKEVPMVFVDKTVNDIRKPLVQSDNYLGAYNLTKELIHNSTVKSIMFFSEEEASAFLPTLIPKEVTFQNYPLLFQGKQMMRSFLISIIVAVSATLICVIISALAAFSFNK